METSNNRLHGIYDTEMELQTEMDRLRAQGYGEEDMYIVSNRNEQLSMYRGSSTYENGNNDVSWWDRFKAFLMGEDLVRDQHFTQMGLTDEERNRYYDELQAGKFLLYVDKNYGSYFDEGAKNYGVNNLYGHDYDQTDDQRLTRREAADINDISNNIDNPLNRTDRKW